MASSLAIPETIASAGGVWDRGCVAAWVPRITVRDARRTCGSLLADLDVHPRVAMQFLRHARFSVTMEI